MGVGAGGWDESGRGQKALINNVNGCVMVGEGAGSRGMTINDLKKRNGRVGGRAG